MTVRKPVTPRWVLSAAVTAALVAVAATPARADIPAAGTVFQIKTAFAGTMLCVSSTRKDSVTWALVPCDREDASQRWKRTANGSLKSVATDECLEHSPYKAVLCKRHEPKDKPWKQDRRGRVLREERNSITRKFLVPLKHNFHGNVLGFVTPSDGTTPKEAGLFAFDSVSR